MATLNLFRYLSWSTCFARLNLLAIIAASTLAVIAPAVHAGSATWKLDPTSNDWSTAANWTPETVPNGEMDVATFNVSNTANVSLDDGILLDSVVFDGDASAYTFEITGGYAGYIAFHGVGVINTSGITQNFDCVGKVGFSGNATAGENIVYTNKAQTGGSPWIVFNDDSDAGSATLINQGDSAVLYAATLVFNGTSSAADSTIINEAGDTYGGGTRFYDSSTAGNSTITSYPGAFIQFSDDSTGSTATLIADGGSIVFENDSQGELARVEIINGGVLILDRRNQRAPVTIGSLEGDGIVTLPEKGLYVGGNGRSTTFSGLIKQSGSLIKTGSEQLTLSGANTYSGGTTVTDGALLAQARTGSATGTGPVRVNAGTLGGRGTVAGAVTIGTGSGAGGFLAPGATRPDTLTLSQTLTFKADGTYQCDLSLGQAKADQVSANGVTIESGAQFVFLPKGVQRLARGTVFTVISNTAATSISGAFANLADGSKLSTGAGNKLRVSYEGGDGNDLTLTVVQ